MNLGTDDGGAAIPQFTTVSSTAATAPGHPVGTRRFDRFGRAFRWVQAGGVDLIAGNVIQSPAVPSGQLTKAVNTTTPTGIGQSSIFVTCASSVAANFYADGYMVIASGAGQGVGPYMINNHAAVSTGATGTFNLYAEDALVVAITNTSTVSLVPNKYKGVIQMPASTATGVIVGVATYIIPAGSFGWIQTWGLCSVLGADTTAIGGWVYGPATACGQASGFTATTLLTGQVIGHLYQANVAAQYVAVDLTISP